MKRLGLLGLGLFLIQPLLAAPEPYFSTHDGIQQHLIAAIDQTQHSLDAAVFDLSASGVIHALRRASERGVAVRLVVDDHVLKEHPDREKLFGSSSIQLRTLKGRTHSGNGMMHNKFAIFDGHQIVTGSYNWTPGAEFSNYENALFLDEPTVVRAFSDQFSDLWERAGVAPSTRGKRAGSSHSSTRSQHGNTRSHYLRPRSSSHRLRLPESHS